MIFFDESSTFMNVNKLTTKVGGFFAHSRVVPKSTSISSKNLVAKGAVSEKEELLRVIMLPNKKPIKSRC